MPSEMGALARKLMGILMLAAGAIGVIVCVISIVDPVGTQLADDGAPFVAPLSAWRSIVLTLAYAALAAAGAWLLRHRFKP